MKKRWKKILLLIILTGTIFGLIMAVNAMQWQRYENKIYGISFLYPSGWEINVTEKEQITYIRAFLPEGEDQKASMVLMVMKDEYERGIERAESAATYELRSFRFQNTMRSQGWSIVEDGDDQGQRVLTVEAEGAGSILRKIGQKKYSIYDILFDRLIPEKYWFHANFTDADIEYTASAFNSFGNGYTFYVYSAVSPEDLKNKKLMGKCMDSFAIRLTREEKAKKDLSYCNLTSLNTVRINEAVTHLDVSVNQIDDIKRLKKYHHLKQLFVDSNEIKTAEPLRFLTHLEVLDLSWNEIEEVDALKELKKLRVLYIDGNEIQDIGPLQGLINLEVLGIMGNPISDFDVLKDFPQLEVLSISVDQTTNLSILTQLYYLEELSLHGDTIGDISHIKELENLKKLYIFPEIRKNQIVSAMSQLETLYLHIDPGYLEIEVLKQLPDLQELYLEGDYSDQDKEKVKAALSGCKINFR